MNDNERKLVKQSSVTIKSTSKNYIITENDILSIKIVEEVLKKKDRHKCQKQ